MKRQKSKKRQSSTYVKYSSIGMQMALTVALFAYLGHWLDNYFQTNKPYITVFFSLFGIFGSFLSIYYRLKEDNEGQ